MHSNTQRNHRQHSSRHTNPQQDPCQVHQEQTFRQVELQHRDEIWSFLCALHEWHLSLNTPTTRYIETGNQSHFDSSYAGLGCTLQMYICTHVSESNTSISLYNTDSLTQLQNTFTGTLSKKLAIKQSLRIPSYIKCVARITGECTFLLQDEMTRQKMWHLAGCNCSDWLQVWLKNHFLAHFQAKVAHLLAPFKIWIIKADSLTAFHRQQNFHTAT